MDQNEGLRKAQILRKIVKVAAQYDLEKAKAIARTISSSPYGEKALAFLEIAK